MSFVLTGGGGIVGFNLPDFTGSYAATAAGPLATTLDGPLVGGMVGFNASTPLGGGEGYTSSVGVSGFLAVAGRSSSSTEVLDAADDYLFIPGITTPTGTITLVTNPVNSTGSAQISGTGAPDQLASIPLNGSGGENVYAVDTGAGNDFSYVGVGTHAGVVDTAMAFGAIATEAGGVFLAVGNLEGTEVTTDLQQSLLYTGGDITFSLTGQPSGGMSFTGYAGPSYRFMGQQLTTKISVDMAEAIADVDSVEFPTYSQTTEEDLATHYVGGIAGASVAVPVSPTASFSVGLEGGVYYSRSSYDASETYSLTGGDPVARDESVTSAAADGQNDGRVAYALRTQATYSTAIGNGMQLSVGVGTEYLSRVAALTRNPAAITGPTVVGDDASYTGADADTGTLLTFGDAWSFTLTASLTGLF